MPIDMLLGILFLHLFSLSLIVLVLNPSRICELYFPGKSPVPLAFRFGQMEELINLTVQRIIIPAAHILFIISRVSLFLSFLDWPKVF